MFELQMNLLCCPNTIEVDESIRSRENNRRVVAFDYDTKRHNAECH